MLLICLISCDEKQEIITQPKQVMVVSKSIDLPKNPVDKVATGKEVLTTDNTVNKKKKEVPSPIGNKTAEYSPAADPLVVNPSRPGTEEKADQELMAGINAFDQTDQKKKTYDTKGRVDPFIPLLSEQKEDAAVSMPVDNKPKRILTPLEKMDLSQIRLVAVIEMKGRSIAMVEEASGKGYEVTIGTYMGKNSGQVSAINENGIIIREYIQDFKGRRKELLQEIKFQKNEGGE